MPVALPCAQCPHPDSVKGIFRFCFSWPLLPSYPVHAVTYPHTLTPRNTETSAPRPPPSTPMLSKSMHVCKTSKTITKQIMFIGAKHIVDYGVQG